MTLDESWNLVGVACYQCMNKQARLALMEIRAEWARRDLTIRQYELRDEIEEQEDEK